MDSFLDSMEPEFSCSEFDGPAKNRYVTIQSSAPTKEVNRLVVACRPESILLEEMCEFVHATSHPVTCTDGSLVGSMFYFGEDAILILDDPSLRFSIADIVHDFQRIIVLSSQMYRVNSCVVLSTDANQTTAPRDIVVESIQAFLLTEAIKINKQASAIINLHTSIRVEFDGLWRLWETLSSSVLGGFPKVNPADVANRFRRACPLNKKVPLYS